MYTKCDEQIILFLKKSEKSDKQNIQGSGLGIFESLELVYIFSLIE